MAIVYQHRRNDNNNVFYVGIGRKEQRAYELKDTRRNRYWKRIANKYGVVVEVTHKDICLEEAQSIEKYLIAFWREYHGKEAMANISDGGDTGNKFIKMPPEAVEKMRIKKLGTKQSEEVKKKRGEAISKALQNPEVRARYAAASTGRWHTDQAKDKISKARTGGGNGKARKVIDTVTGEIFDCMKDAANKYGIPCGTLQHYLTGYCKNKTNLKYLD
jgi:hypothetical protein